LSKEIADILEEDSEELRSNSTSQERVIRTFKQNYNQDSTTSVKIDQLLTDEIQELLQENYKSA
jgi:hypothetical protein